jgi:hypothetical protein
MNIAFSEPFHFPNVVHVKTPNSRACTRGSAGALRPLRVLRVVEAGQTSSHTGRLVISGRMADVCAELDRLAAFEHTH